MCAVLNFYLDSQKRSRAEAGDGIFGLVTAVVKAAGWQVCYRNDADPVTGDGYHLVYNREVLEPNCLSLRRCYLDHYFRIEASNDRWEWEVARKPYTPQLGTEWFMQHWRERLFKGQPIADGGYIFMPLQGKLLLRRHFQALSPIEMIHATLAADASRRILATLHPRESYTPDELAALHGIDRFQLVTTGSLPLLTACDYVVTQNSAVALTGFFAQKPAVLFAKIDFHHIAASVPHIGMHRAFAEVFTPRPYGRYLHWFFKQNALCDVGDDRAANLQARLRAHGWPI